MNAKEALSVTILVLFLGWSASMIKKYNADHRRALDLENAQWEYREAKQSDAP